MDAATPCAACGERGHRATKCSTLREPLKEGFQGGGSGGGGHSHEDDEGAAVVTSSQSVAAP